MKGVVNAAFDPAIPLAVQGPPGDAHSIEAIVDTGFNGFLTSSPSTL